MCVWRGPASITIDQLESDPQWFSMIGCLYPKESQVLLVSLATLGQIREAVPKVSYIQALSMSH